MSKLIAVCPEQYPGVSAVFKHGERLGYWEFQRLNQDLKLPERNDCTLLLGAWSPAYMALLKTHNCGIYLTSTIGQMEFSNDQIELRYLTLLQDLYKTGVIKFILTGWPDIVYLFNHIDAKRIFHCPYPFDFSYLEKIEKQEKITNSAGIFLPQAPRKNILNQYLAVKLADYKLYTNCKFDDPNTISCDWAPDQEYFTLISKLQATLHCTYTESFSYAAAESLVLGTLPIVSFQVARNLGYTSDDSSICPQVDSISEIADVLVKLKNEPYDSKLKERLKEFKEHILKENQPKTELVLDKITNL